LFPGDFSVFLLYTEMEYQYKLFVFKIYYKFYQHIFTFINIMI